MKLDQLDTKMHFLHSDPEKAAAALCDQDVLGTLNPLMIVLANCHKNDFKWGDGVSRWIEEDGLNYHWLGYFAERLNARLPSSEKHNHFYSEIMSLRRAVPERLRCIALTPFPLLVLDQNVRPHLNDRDPSSTLPVRLAAYRADYVLSRHSYAEWTTAKPPGWFFRLANTILSEGDRSAFLLRVQPAGPDDSDDKGVGESERKAVRDGPAGEIDGGTGGKFVIW